MLNVTYTTLSLSNHELVRLPGEYGGMDLDAIVTTRLPIRLPIRLPWTKAAEVLDSDRAPGTVNSVVTVS
jgi:hypothetical protein